MNLSCRHRVTPPPLEVEVRGAGYLTWIPAPACFLLILLAAGARAADWPIFRGDAGLTGVAPGALPDAPALLWSFKAGTGIKSSPAIAGGRVFVGTDDGRVCALRLRDGQPLWTASVGGAVEAPPLVSGGAVYLGGTDGKFRALSATNGAVLWTFGTDGPIPGSANLIPGSHGGATWVVFGSHDHSLYCLDALGRRVWRYDTENFINGAPAVSAGSVVFAGCDAILHIVSAADGSERGRVEIGSYAAASPAVAEGRAYVGQYEGKLVCVELAGPRLVWEYASDSPEGAFFSCPAVTPDVVIAGSRDKAVHAVDRETGQRRWVFQTRGKVDASAVVCGDRVVVGSQDGRVSILNLADGTERWTYDAGAPIEASPAVSDGLLVLGAGDGRIYAFGSPEAKP